MTEKKKVGKSQIRFSKAQILASEKYFNRKDALSVCLEDKDHTVEEVEKTLKKFMEGKVK